MKTEKAISIVTGAHWVKRTWVVFKNIGKGLKRIADGGSSHLPRDPKSKAKYRVYTPTKKKSFYANSFGEALSAAYSEADIEKMAQGERNKRYIQAYGAAIICIIAVSDAISRHSISPLFSITPAMALLAFAMQHACMEETLKRRELVTLRDYLSSRGIFGVWK